MDITVLDVSVFVGYFVIILGIGFFAGRGEGKNAKEYFLAGGKLPWYIIGASLVAGSVNSEQMVGTVGKSWEEGMKIVNWETWGLPIIPIMLFLFLPILLRNKISTVPEFMEKRFGPACRNYVTIITIFYYVFASLTVAVYGGAVTISTYFEFPLYYAIWGIILFTAIYTIYGGLSAVAWTDLIQTLLITIGGIMLFCFAYSKTEGFAAMEAANPERWHLIQPANDLIVPWPGLIIHTMTTLFFYYVCNQVLMQKILAARSERDARVGTIFCVILNAPRPLITAMAGLLAFYIVKESQVENPDQIFSILVKTCVPAGLRSFILVAILAAMVSTTAALSNSSSALLTLDVYHKYFGKQASDKHLVLFGRLATLAILVAVGLWCPMVKSFSGIFMYFQQFMIYVGTPIACIFLIAIFWKRANGIGAFAALILVTPVLLICGFIFSDRIAFQYIAGIGWVATLLVTVIVSLLTKPQEIESIRSLIWKKEMAWVAGEIQKPPLYMRQWFWLIIATAIFAFWYIRFW